MLRTQGEGLNESPTPPVIEELRLTGDFYQRTSRLAMSRFLAVRESLREGLEPEPERIAAATADFRRARGLDQRKICLPPMGWPRAAWTWAPCARLMEDEVRVGLDRRPMRKRHLGRSCSISCASMEITSNSPQRAAQANGSWLSRRGLLNPTCGLRRAL